MGTRRTAPKWRSLHVTTEESLLISSIDREIDGIRSQLKKLSRERSAITRRILMRHRMREKLMILNKTNQWPGICYRCGEIVPAGQGRFVSIARLTRLAIRHQEDCQPAPVEAPKPRLPVPIRLA
jgi:hypothetical protein